MEISDAVSRAMEHSQAATNAYKQWQFNPSKELANTYETVALHSERALIKHIFADRSRFGLQISLAELYNQCGSVSLHSSHNIRAISEFKAAIRILQDAGLQTKSQVSSGLAHSSVHHLAFLMDDSERADYIAFQKGINIRGMSYGHLQDKNFPMYAHHWREARSVFQYLSDEAHSPEIQAQSLLNLVQMSYQENRVQEGRLIFRELFERFTFESPVVQEAMIYMGEAQHQLTTDKSYARSPSVQWETIKKN